MSKYADQISAMVWSYSRLSAFEQCKYAFYLKYIIADNDEYLAEGNFWAELGSFVHEILEKVFKGELDPDDAPSYFIDHYDANVCYTASESIMGKSFEDCLTFLSEADYSQLESYEILGVEKELSLQVSGYEFKGYIDLLLQNKETGDIVIVDHKSSSYPLSEKTGKPLKAHAQNFESYKKQMYLYCHAVKQLYGKFPQWIVWNHFKAQKIVRIPFNEQDYQKTMRWFRNTIKAIQKEESFPETIDYFYCHHLCDFRNCCEYKQYTSKLR